jgi:CheY-like chemotaxis protein
MVVQTYATGDELLESLALKCFDCLILDLQMPKMSGLDVLNHLRYRQIRLPTIVITAHDEPGSRSACLNAGAAAYLCKPLDADHLIQTIGTVCVTPAREAPLHEASPPFP